MSYLFLKHFHIISAAGGVVHKPTTQQLLLIKRKGYWDLPKGKSKNKERKVFTAKREVEEECGIKVQCRNKIATTYHVMPMRSGLFRLKRTTWFAMHVLNEQGMAPQTEEGIEEVRWMSAIDAIRHVADSYPSIQHVLYAWLLVHKPQVATSRQLL